MPFIHGLGAFEYKIRSTPDVNSSLGRSLLTFDLHWVLDSACTFSFTFDSPILHLLRFILAHFPFILDFQSRLHFFVLTTGLTSRLHCLFNQQHLLICVTHLTEMRRNDIVSGILLILSTINFALAAPVSAQLEEERRTRVYVVHVPKDATTVLGKRGGEELEKLAEEYFKTWGKPVEASDAHALLSSVPAGPDHGLTNVVQAQAPNRVSSTANPDPLIEPSSCSSSTSSMHARGHCLSVIHELWNNDNAWMQGLTHFDWDEGTFISPLNSPPPSEYFPDHEYTAAHAPQPQWQQQPNPYSSADPSFDGEYWMNSGDSSPQKTASPPNALLEGQASGYAPSWPEFNSSPGSEVLSPSPGAGSPTWPEHGSSSESEHGTSTEPKHRTSTEPEHEVVHGRPPSLELTDPEHQSLSANSQPVDLQAIIYAAKGKAKESPHISGTARYVGEEAQRELQPAERSLDPGE